MTAQKSDILHTVIQRAMAKPYGVVQDIIWSKKRK
jgi:hypothetical protein